MEQKSQIKIQLNSDHQTSKESIVIIRIRGNLLQRGYQNQQLVRHEKLDDQRSIGQKIDFDILQHIKLRGPQIETYKP